MGVPDVKGQASAMALEMLVYKGAPVKEPTIADAVGLSCVFIDFPLRIVLGLPLPYVVPSSTPVEGYTSTAELANVVVKL